MKTFLSLATVVIVVLTATLLASNTPTTFHSIEGTWELQSFHNYDDNEITGTQPKSDGYRQVKMYYNGHIMWTRYVPEEPNGRFGYGSYRITENQLIETLEYGDAEMMKAMDTMRVFTFDLELKDDFYSQINLDEEGNRTFSENYKRID